MVTNSVGISAELGLRTSYRDPFEEQETPASATGGLRYQRGWLVLHGGAGAGVSSGVGAPDFRMLGVAGIALPSNRGGERFNQRLSESRAASVLEFLVDAGVPADRLSSQGFGESKPLVSNKSAAGRAKNRRVEFRFSIPEEGSP